MARPHHVVLIPGFFGFANLGDFTYFGHVRDRLPRSGRPSGSTARSRWCRPSRPPRSPGGRRSSARPSPGSSTSAPGRVALIGHSSGGLDARLLCTPGVVAPHQRRPGALRPGRLGGGLGLHPAPRHAAGPLLLRAARPADPAAPLAHHHPRAAHRPAAALGGHPAGRAGAARQGAPLRRAGAALQAAPGRLLRRAAARRGGLPGRRAGRPGAGGAADALRHGGVQRLGGRPARPALRLRGDAGAPARPRSRSGRPASRPTPSPPTPSSWRSTASPPRSPRSWLPRLDRQQAAVLRQAYGRIPAAAGQRRHRADPEPGARPGAPRHLGRPPRRAGPLRRPDPRAAPLRLDALRLGASTGRASRRSGTTWPASWRAPATPEAGAPAPRCKNRHAIVRSGTPHRWLHQWRDTRHSMALYGTRPAPGGGRSERHRGQRERQEGRHRHPDRRGRRARPQPGHPRRHHRGAPRGVRGHRHPPGLGRPHRHAAATPRPTTPSTTRSSPTRW